MCAETQAQLEKLAQQVGNTEGIKRARILIANQDSSTRAVKREMSQIKKDIAGLQTLAEERKKDSEKIRADLEENTRKTNFVYDAVVRVQQDVAEFKKSKLFEDAAVMNFFRGLFCTTTGKLILIFLAVLIIGDRLGGFSEIIKALL